MPINPKAVFITDPHRAAQLFPAQDCRQCAGSTKVQRYAETDCKTCNGSGGTKTDQQDSRAAMLAGACGDCWNDAQKRSTGKRHVPEVIPCPGCGGKGRKSRVSESRPQTLAAAKAGDWVVIGVEFPSLPIEDLKDSKFVGASAELISCMVVRVPPGRIIARVLQSPEYSDAHGLKYGELLEIGPNHVLVHTQCTQEEFEKARDGRLFEFAPQNPIAPQPGRNYITRGGNKAVVWTMRNDQAGQFAIGNVAGRDTEWNMDGTARNGARDSDLVQFTEVVNT